MKSKSSFLTTSLFLSMVFVKPLSAQLEDPFADRAPVPRSEGDSAPSAGDLGASSADPFIRDAARPVMRNLQAALGEHNLLFLTEFIEVDPVLLSGMLQEGEIDLSDGQAVRGVVDEWMTNDQGRLMDWSLQLSRGERSKVEATAEIIYAVEWDPGESLPLFQSATAAPLREKKRPAIPMMVDGVTYWPPACWPHPTTFEMRPAGICSEVEIAWGDAPHVSAAPEMVIHQGGRSSSHIAGVGAEASAPSLPRFATSRIGAPIEPLSEGGVRWLGTSRTGEDKPLMVFMTASPLGSERPKVERKGVEGIRAVAELIEVDKSWIEDRISENGAPAGRTDDLRADIQESVQQGTASILGMVSASTSLNDMGRGEALREIIYASEYHPANLPGYEVPEGTDIRFWSPDAFPNPNAYVTRNVGFTLQFTAAERGDPSGLDVDLFVDYVEHLEDRVAHAFLTPRGVEPLCTMPTFSTLRITTRVFAQPGESLLLGALARRQPNGEPVPDKQVLMFFRLLP